MFQSLGARALAKRSDVDECAEFVDDSLQHGQPVEITKLLHVRELYMNQITKRYTKTVHPYSTDVI